MAYSSNDDSFVVVTEKTWITKLKKLAAGLLVVLVASVGIIAWQSQQANIVAVESPVIPDSEITSVELSREQILEEMTTQSTAIDFEFQSSNPGISVDEVFLQMQAQEVADTITVASVDNASTEADLLQQMATQEVAIELEFPQ